MQSFFNLDYFRDRRKGSPWGLGQLDYVMNVLAPFTDFVADSKSSPFLWVGLLIYLSLSSVFRRFLKVSHMQ